MRGRFLALRVTYMNSGHAFSHLPPVLQDRLFGDCRPSMKFPHLQRAVVPCSKIIMRSKFMPAVAESSDSDMPARERQALATAGGTVLFILPHVHTCQVVIAALQVTRGRELKL